jgi:hypothetical protein
MPFMAGLFVGVTLGFLVYTLCGSAAKSETCSQPHSTLSGSKLEDIA